MGGVHAERTARPPGPGSRQRARQELTRANCDARGWGGHAGGRVLPGSPGWSEVSACRRPPKRILDLGLSSRVARCVAGLLCILMLLAGRDARATALVATLHYTSNGVFDNGVFLPASLGFNLADVSSSSQLAELPSGVSALVYVGSCDGADAEFIAQVSPFIGDSRVFGFYLMDEPDPTGLYKPICPPANLKSESDWIHQNDPAARTFIVLMNLSSSDDPNYQGTYNPTNTDVDLFGLDPYPCRTELGGCDDSYITKAVAAAEAAGIPQSDIVPVFQAFGGGTAIDDGGGHYALPTPSQERAILNTWSSVAPEPVFDYAYSWGSQDGDFALDSSPDLQAVFQAHNGSGTGAGPAPLQIYGSDAIATAIAVSQAAFPDPSSAGAVVLARSDAFADALAGGPLAARLKAPLLITPGTPESAALDPRVLAEIERVLSPGGTVYILGGPLALSPNIDATLEQAGYQAVRIAGADQYATAVDIAQALGNPSTIFEATAVSFGDALSAVPAAIGNSGAILLTAGPVQSPETMAYLAAHPADTRYAIGGPLAAAGADPGATAVWGEDEYGTSAAVASRFFPEASLYGVATGAGFPDALAGGLFMATGGRRGPLLLVDPQALPAVPPSIASYLATLAPGTVGFVFGGPLAVPPSTVAEVQGDVG